MKGYGDPSASGLGYGDPSTGAILDRGYGSPFMDDVLFLTLESREIHYRGGAEIIIAGIISPDLAPFRISMNINSVTHYLYSGIAGNGSNLSLERGKLICYSVPSPTGVYALTVHYGPLFGQSFTLTDTLTVGLDSRGAERYQARRLWPSHYKTGARSSRQEMPLTLPQPAPTSSPLLTINDTAGRMWQSIMGSPETVVTNNHSQGSSTIALESALTFPESGFVWIDGHRYEYSLTLNQMTLASPLRFNIPAGEVVTYAQ